MKKRTESAPPDLGDLMKSLTDEKIRHNALLIAELGTAPGFVVLYELVTFIESQIVANGLRDTSRSRSYYAGAQDSIKAFRRNVLEMFEHAAEEKERILREESKRKVPGRTPLVDPNIEKGVEEETL